MTPWRLLELELEILKAIMEGQDPDVQKKLWERHLKHVDKLLERFGITDEETS